MISDLNLAYGVRETRSWMRVRMAAVALTIAISILILAALLLALASSPFVEWIGRELRLQPLIVTVWADYSMACSCLLLNRVLLFDLFGGAGLEGTSLALDYARFGLWCHHMG
jgi:uncharacterized BrkB/YihY/UPF0761 family membrane protein